MTAEERLRDRAAHPLAGAAAARRPGVLTLDHVWLAVTLVFAFLTGTLLAAEQPDYCGRPAAARHGSWPGGGLCGRVG